MPGLVNTGSQTFAGAKTFNGTLTVNNTINTVSTNNGGTVDGAYFRNDGSGANTGVVVGFQTDVNTNATITGYIANYLQFQVHNGSSLTDILRLDGANARVYVGNSSADGTGTQLVLDSKNTSADPSTGVNGGMYYNSATHIFRCYRDGAWSDCAINEIDHAYSFEEDFLSGLVATGSIGSLGWAFTGNCGTLAYNATTPITLGHDHPGTFNILSGATSGHICILQQSTNKTITVAAEDVIKTNAVITGTLNNVIYRTGFTNQGTTSTTQPTSGAWWEADNTTDTNWRYCYANSGAATCADNTNGTPTITANSWVKLEIRIVSSTAIDFIYNGTKVSLTGITFDSGATNKLTPTMACGNRTAASQTCIVDYFQWRGVITTSGGR
jgi:hypothetical protein